MKIRYLPILLWLFSTVNYAAQPPVEFQAPIPQFHDMVAGATETETYVLINHVRQPLPLLSISGFSSPLSRNFNVANNCGQTLPALGTCAIQLTANGSQVGTINQSLIVNYGGRSPLVTPISFSVTSPIAFTATPAVSNMLVNSTQSLLYTITNVSSDTVSLSFSGFGSPITRSAGVVNNCGSSLAAGASCNVLLMAAPTTTGNISQSLIANFGSGTISSPISFQVQAVGVDEANSSAAIFGFGGSVSDTDRKKILRGQLVTGTITVKNFSSSDVVANLSASISAPSGVNASIGSTTCGDTLAAGASCTYTVNFQASNATFSAGLAAYPAHFLLNYNETSGTASISYPFELYQFNPGIFAQLPFNIGGSFNSLPSNSIRAITGNADGSRLYAATDRGLAVSLNHGKNWYVVTPSMGLSYPKLGDVFVDGNNLYVASLNGLNISTDGGTSFVKRTTSDGLGSNIVNSVYASGNNVYVGTVNGVSISTDGGQSFTNITSGLADNIVLGIAAASGYVYAATSAGLGVLDPNEGDTFTNITGHGLGSNSINDVFVANNKIYAATQNGLSIAPFNSDPTQLSFVNHNFVNSNNIFSVYVSGNNVYVTTIDSFAISADGGQTFTESPLLVPPIASDIFAYGANIYIATDLDGVYVSPDYGQTLNQYTVSAVIPSDEAYGVYAQGNNLYVGTSNGLAISPDQGSTFALRTTSNGLGDNHVRSVYGNGNNIYVGTLGGGYLLPVIMGLALQTTQRHKAWGVM